VAPLAVSPVDDPLQIVTFEPPLTGTVFTVTVVLAADLQPFTSVPVTVYVVVEEGLAVTGVPVVAESPVDGLHAYVTLPEAVSGVELPLHIDVDELAEVAAAVLNDKLPTFVPLVRPLAVPVTLVTVMLPDAADVLVA